MASPSTDEKRQFARLPENVVPQKYFIDYDVIDLMNYRFEASERIEIDVKEATHTVTCHAVELYVYDVTVTLPGASDAKPTTKTLPCTQIQYINDDESVTFHFAEPLLANTRVTLALRFHGFLNDKLRGFYRTEYDLASEKRVLAVTQFEACDARRAFVCWDEPAIKARFEISMVTDANLTALSNTHVVQTQVRPKKNAHLRKLTRTDAAVEKYWKFAETPVMSTYIVAMVVGEFDVLTDISDEGVIVNVYTAPGQAERGRFSLDVATRALSFFSKQFGIPYPLKKLDMVAIPDFLGAMENWGLVTYTETYLLVDEKLTSHEIKVDAARTVCHELSHQWFGNLVTMDWWTGLWLNEGFAQYMEFDAVNALFPEWKVWELFVQEVLLGSAFVKDAMVTSHPIEVVVHHPKEVDEIFDVISYHKGASVVRMLAEFLGRDVFYLGVHNYLVKYSYQNTKTEDLWDALEEASGLKITQMASSWTKQTGYPLVTVEQEADGAYKLKQERFFSDFDMKKDDATLWDVPLTLVTSEAPTEIKRVGIWDAHTVASESTKVTPFAAREEVNKRVCCAVPSGSSWVKLNPNQSSYYLANYTPEMWKQLQEPVKALELGVVDRVSLISSAFKLASAGVLSVADALDFTSAYVNETEYLVWKQIASNISRYSSLFGDEPFYPQIQEFTRELFSSVMERLTWEPTEEDKQHSITGDFRAIAISRMGNSGDEAVIEESHKRFARYMSGEKAALSADLRGVVFGIHARNTSIKDSREVVKQLQQLYETSDFAEEKEDCLRTMGLVPDLQVKREVLEWALLSGAVKNQETTRALSGVAFGQAGVRLTWDFITSNYEAISARFSPLMLGGVVAIAVSRFQSESDAVDVEKFKASVDVSGYVRRLDGALEGVRLRSKEYARDRDAVAKWLEQRQKQ